MNREIYSIKGNPRHLYKAPGNCLTLAFRLRLSPTNKLSCGIQPANIRLINRRVKFPFHFHLFIFVYFKKIKKKWFLFLTERHIISEVPTSNKQILNEYLILKEQYDLLVYKRFARSAEQLLADEKQQLLFAEEAEQPETNEEKPLGLQTVKSFTRNKGGRKPISANLERRPRVIDIPEDEKTCACGAVLTKMAKKPAKSWLYCPRRFM